MRCWKNSNRYLKWWSAITRLDMFIKLYARNNHHLLTIIHDKLQPLGLSSSQTLISFHTAIDRQLPIADILTNDVEAEDK